MPVPQGRHLPPQHVSLNCPWRRASASTSLSTTASGKSCFTVPTTGMVTSATERGWTPWWEQPLRLPPEDLLEPTCQSSTSYVFGCLLLTWECQRTSHPVELTDFMSHYLSKAEAHFTNKTSYLTSNLLQNAFSLHLESAFCCTLRVSGTAMAQYF